LEIGGEIQEQEDKHLSFEEIGFSSGFNLQFSSANIKITVFKPLFRKDVCMFHSNWCISASRMY